MGSVKRDDHTGSTVLVTRVRRPNESRRRTQGANSLELCENYTKPASASRGRIAGFRNLPRSIMCNDLAVFGIATP